MRAILKRFDDGTHYHLSAGRHLNHRSPELTASDCRFAAVDILVMLGRPIQLRAQHGDFTFNKTYERGVGKEHELKGYTVVIREDFNHADELYERLMNVDAAIQKLRDPYESEK